MPLLQPGSRSAKWQAQRAALEATAAEQAALAADAKAVTADAKAVTADNKAVAADGKAVTAQADAGAANRRVAITGSWTTGGPSLNASDAGASASIAIGAHARHFGADTAYPSVNVAGSSIVGLAYSTRYYIYYDDLTLANTTPAFQATTNGAIAQHNYVPGRIGLGTVATPAAGGAAVSGGGTEPPGGGGGGEVL